MMVRQVRSWVLILAFLLLPDAQAALFCVTDFGGRRCTYPDLDACRRAAGQQGGCDLNTEELVKPTGAAPFCLVESWRTECNYMDRLSCEKRAAMIRTVCIVNPNAPGVEANPLAPPQGYMPSPNYLPGGEK
ncbi:MAG: hypothetical protein HQL95_07225 [Magnetococcales bacterium]|nr:hypothetical protein [Magnetococcales bacterium]